MSGEWIWEPSPEWIERTNVWRFMRMLGLTDREAFLGYSRDHLEEFWDQMVREAGIEWFRPYDRVLDTSRGVEWAQWFLGGKLNIAQNCLERHRASGKVACIWEGEDGATRSLTFADLAHDVNRLANGLRMLGLAKGDRVALVMPMVPEVVTILYACFKLGLIVVPIFAGFGAAAIATRLENSGARVVFTSDCAQRRGKLLPLKEKVDQALERPTSVEKVIVYRYKGGNVGWRDERDLWWDDFVRGQSTECPPLTLDSEDRALILYTSGTTGRPKGTVHTHAGALAQMTKEIYLAFDHQPDDRFWWLSDIGWMMGPWSIIGNHNFAGTIFMYDGAPDYPGPRPPLANGRTPRHHHFRHLAHSNPFVDAQRPARTEDAVAAPAGLDGRAVGRYLVSVVFRKRRPRALPDHQYFGRHRNRGLFPVPAAHPAFEALHSGRPRARNGDRGRRRCRPSGPWHKGLSRLHQACTIHDAGYLVRSGALHRNLLVALAGILVPRRLGQRR
jgi:AMP-binding enzyme